MRAAKMFVFVSLLIAGLSILYNPPKLARAQNGAPPEEEEEGPVPQTLFCGLWRTDNGFSSVIHIKNSLVVGPLAVTPVLYMADGFAYELPPVLLATAGAADVDVNQALANAPPAVAGHRSFFGSAALRYEYATPGHVVGSISIVNLAESLILTGSFSGVVEELTGAQTIEGLWWKREPGVSGFVSVANATEAAMEATVQAIGSRGTLGIPQALALAPHASEMLELDLLIQSLPAAERRAGGLRVIYNGPQGAVLVFGGLLNERNGYSANMPFWIRDTASPAEKSTYASLGIRVGRPEAAEGFPSGTRFTPYTVLRNVTPKALAVAVALNYMRQGAPVTVPLPSQILGPFESRQLDFAAVMSSVRLAGFSGMLNLTVSFTGRTGDLIEATGSADQTGSYVFEVMPQAIQRTHSKVDAFWTVAAGSDTMYTLWNPTDQAQDFLVTFYYADGSGKYKLPVHLEAHASASISMEQLIRASQPDEDGSVIPPTVLGGSAVFASASGVREWMTLVVSGGVFNAQTATCGSSCINCCGYSGFGIGPANGFCDFGGTLQCDVHATYCNGQIAYFTGSSSWSSGNTAVATVDNGSSKGLVTGVYPGTANISAQMPFLITFTGTICGPSPSCPGSAPWPSMNLPVKPRISISCDKQHLALGSTAPSDTARGTCTTTASPSGGTYSWSVNTSTVTLSPSGGSAGYASSNQSASRSDTLLTVLYNVSNQTRSATSAGITVHRPNSLTVNSDVPDFGILCIKTCPQPGTCTLGTGTCSYTTTVRVRNYSVLDQFLDKFENVSLNSVNVTESFPVTSTCPDVSSLQTGSALQTPFQDTVGNLCSRCCEPGGAGCSLTTNPTQIIAVNGIGVRANTITVSCGGVSISP